MLKMLRNKKGVVPDLAVVFFIAMTAVLTKGLVETHQNGVLKKNGQKIWCKMQNKGADYCDATYQ